MAVSKGWVHLRELMQHMPGLALIVLLLVGCDRAADKATPAPTVTPVLTPAHVGVDGLRTLMV